MVPLPQGEGKDVAEYLVWYLFICGKSAVFLGFNQEIVDEISLPLGEGGPLAVDEASPYHHSNSPINIRLYTA